MDLGSNRLIQTCLWKTPCTQCQEWWLNHWNDGLRVHSLWLFFFLTYLELFYLLWKNHNTLSAIFSLIHFKSEVISLLGPSIAHLLYIFLWQLSYLATCHCFCIIHLSINAPLSSHPRLNNILHTMNIHHVSSMAMCFRRFYLCLTLLNFNLGSVLKLWIKCSKE